TRCGPPRPEAFSLNLKANMPPTAIRMTDFATIHRQLFPTLNQLSAHPRRFESSAIRGDVPLQDAQAGPQLWPDLIDHGFAFFCLWPTAFCFRVLHLASSSSVWVSRSRFFSGGSLSRSSSLRTSLTHRPHHLHCDHLSERITPCPRSLQILACLRSTF